MDSQSTAAECLTRVQRNTYQKPVPNIWIKAVDYSSSSDPRQRCFSRQKVLVVEVLLSAGCDTPFLTQGNMRVNVLI